MSINYFVQINKGIDEEIKREKTKSKSIRTAFLIIDIVLILLIITIEVILQYIFTEISSSGTDPTSIQFIVNLYPLILEAAFSLILAFSAFYLARSVRGTTGRKQNTCLLNWHIFNLIVLIVILAFIAIFLREKNIAPPKSEKELQYQYYYDLTDLASHIFKVYMDLFLLWILYRFMKPQRIFRNGQTEASALLFAHDA